MDCSLLGGGNSLEYNMGVIENHNYIPFTTEGYVIPEHRAFFEEGVRLMNKAYYDNNSELVSKLVDILYSFVSWVKH